MLRTFDSWLMTALTGAAAAVVVTGVGVVVVATAAGFTAAVVVAAAGGDKDATAGGASEGDGGTVAIGTFGPVEGRAAGDGGTVAGGVLVPVEACAGCDDASARVPAVWTVRSFTWAGRFEAGGCDRVGGTGGVAVRRSVVRGGGATFDVAAFAGGGAVLPPRAVAVVDCWLFGRFTGGVTGFAVAGGVAGFAVAGGVPGFAVDGGLLREETILGRVNGSSAGTAFGGEFDAIEDDGNEPSCCVGGTDSDEAAGLMMPLVSQPGTMFTRETTAATTASATPSTTDVPTRARLRAAGGR